MQFKEHVNNLKIYWNNDKEAQFNRINLQGTTISKRNYIKEKLTQARF